MDESPEQARRREEVLRTHTALKQALNIITDISTSTISTPLPPPVDNSWLHSGSLHRRSPPGYIVPKKHPARPALSLPICLEAPAPPVSNSIDTTKTTSRPKRVPPNVPRRPTQQPRWDTNAHLWEKVPTTRSAWIVIKKTAKIHILDTVENRLGDSKTDLQMVFLLSDSAFSGEIEHCAEVCSCFVYMLMFAMRVSFF